MPDQIIDSNPSAATAESAQNGPMPPFTEETTGGVPPSPADLPRLRPQQIPDHPRQQPQQVPQPAEQPPAEPDGDVDDAKAPPHVRKLRNENANLRERLRALEAGEGDPEAGKKVRDELKQLRQKLAEAEPILQKHQEQEEAGKSEAQRAIERAEAAEQRYREQVEADQEREQNFQRLNMAVTHGIRPDNIDLIGSGSREQMEANALKVKAMQDAQDGVVAGPPSNRPVEGLRPGASPEPPAAADDSYPESWKPKHVRERERTTYGQ